MSVRKVGLDLQIIPHGLMAQAKAHLRIDGIHDDHYIVATLARSIGWFERVTGVTVNPVTYTWTPRQKDFCNGVAPVPVSPVNSWTAAIGVDDVTANYDIEADVIHGVEINRLVGAWASGLTLTIPSGYASAATIDPGITDLVMRYTAHLYENREILVAGADTQTPGWMTDAVAGYWKPRV